VKLVTWNTQWCCGLDRTVSPRRIVEGARAMTDFDVLCLQEIAQGYDNWAGAPGDQPAELGTLLPDYSLFFGAAVDEFGADGRRRRFGNLVATRLPVAQVEHHALPWPPDPAVMSMPRMVTVVTVLDPALGAVRVMTTHLEYYSAVQRLAQARAVHAVHAEACARAAAPPVPGSAKSPFGPKPQTMQAILCGDFNAAASDAAYRAIIGDRATPGDKANWYDAWRLAHGDTPQPLTFHVFDRRYGPAPLACDFIFVSGALTTCVQRVDVDSTTQASDHQPVCVEFA
jgi:endonuclease/exonuclease/phosphatase family metal-dependent hydrolase